MADLFFAIPPERFRPVFDQLVAQVDWRPLDHAGKPPPPTGTVRPTHVGSIQSGGKPMRCYKLAGGENVFNGEDMANLLGVSIEALTDTNKFMRELAAHG